MLNRSTVFPSSLHNLVPKAFSGLLVRGKKRKGPGNEVVFAPTALTEGFVVFSNESPR